MTEIFIMTVCGIVGAFTYFAFRDPRLMEKFRFHTDSILVKKEYYRMFSSGFLHVDWMHFGLNMFAFYTFAMGVGMAFGLEHLMLVTLFGLLGGSLLSLYVHRNNGNYTAVGFSGAVSAVVCYSVALLPHLGIGLIFIPGLYIEGWMFAPLFMLYSLYGIVKQHDNIGHAAHAGGAIIGLLYGIGAMPDVATKHLLYLLPVVVISAILLFIVFFRQDMLLTRKTRNRDHNRRIVTDKRDYGPARPNKALQEAANLDEVLDKINSTGIESLSAAERRILDRHARK